MKFFLFSFLLVLPLLSNNLNLELNDLKKDCKNKTVHIELLKEGGISIVGQGFFISRDGYLLTAKHVIENMIEETCYIFWIDEYDNPHYLKSILISQHPTQDIALLKTIHPLGQDFPYFEFDFSFPFPGTWVFLSYFDADHVKYFLRGGKILHLENNEINMSIRSCPGDSGSPCVLFNGKVIGLNFGRNNMTNICIPFSSFNSWLFPLIY